MGVWLRKIAKDPFNNAFDVTLSEARALSDSSSSGQTPAKQLTTYFLSCLYGFLGQGMPFVTCGFLLSCVFSHSLSIACMHVTLVSGAWNQTS